MINIDEWSLEYKQPDYEYDDDGEPIDVKPQVILKHDSGYTHKLSYSWSDRSLTDVILEAVYECADDAKYSKDYELALECFNELIQYHKCTDYIREKALEGRSSVHFKQKTVHKITSFNGTVPFIGDTGIAVRYLLEVIHKGTTDDEILESHSQLNHPDVDNMRSRYAKLMKSGRIRVHKEVITVDDIGVFNE